MEIQGIKDVNSSVIINALRKTETENNTVTEGWQPNDQIPEITVQFHTNSLALAVVCSITSVAIVALFLYCCCRALKSDGSYDCSCTYEKPAPPESKTPKRSSSTVISGSLSFRTEYKHHSFKPKTETIMEESEESSVVYTSPYNKQTC